MGIVLSALRWRSGRASARASDTVPALALCGGSSAYLASYVAIRWRVSRSVRGGRLLATIVFAALFPVALVVPALAAVALVAATWIGLHAYEIIWWREARAETRALRAPAPSSGFSPPQRTGTAQSDDEHRQQRRHRGVVRRLSHPAPDRQRADRQRLPRRVAGTQRSGRAEDLRAGLTHPDRFLGDCELVADLEHPAVLPLYDWGEIDGTTYVAMRHIEGSNLESLLLGDGPLPTEQTLTVVDQVAGALHAAHCCGVVHRDLKPSNVLLEADSDRVFVTDFGVGGPVSAYSAPERAEGKRLDGRTDVYSLGRVLADCVRDREIETVVAKATAKDRTERYAMAAELAEACTAALPRPSPAKAAPLPVVEAPELEPGEPENQEAPGGRRRRLWLVAGGVLAVGAVAAVLAAVLGGGGGHESAQPSASPSEPSALAPAQLGMTARTQGVSRSVAAAAALPLAAPPLYDVVAFSSGTASATGRARASGAVTHRPPTRAGTASCLAPGPQRASSSASTATRRAPRCTATRGGRR